MTRIDADWRLAAGVAGRDVEPVGDQKGHQGAPEHHVEHHRRTDPLGAEGESGVGTAHARLGEEPVPEGGPGAVPPGETWLRASVDMLIRNRRSRRGPSLGRTAWVNWV